MSKPPPPYLPVNIRTAVIVKIQATLQLAKQHFGRPFGMPEVQFDVHTHTAGIAYSTLNKIRFNPTLLLENTDKFISETVPHEVAHLVADAVFPSGFLHRRVRQKARAPHHGEAWEYVMRLFGLEPKVSHKYSCASLNKPKRYAHKCSECGATIQLTLKQAKLVRFNKKALHHKSCGLPSILVPVVGSLPVSKREHCEHIYIKHRTQPRQAIIEQFVIQAKCTHLSASTYYSRLRNKYDC